VAQAVENLLCQCKALSSNPSSTKKKKKKKKKEKKINYFRSIVEIQNPH
jgi:hypothetical protein